MSTHKLCFRAKKVKPRASFSKLMILFILKRFIKILIVNIRNMLLFLLEKCENLLMAKESHSGFDNVIGIYITSLPLNNVIRLTMLYALNKLSQMYCIKLVGKGVYITMTC